MDASSGSGEDGANQRTESNNPSNVSNLPIRVTNLKSPQNDPNDRIHSEKSQDPLESSSPNSNVYLRVTSSAGGSKASLNAETHPASSLRSNSSVPHIQPDQEKTNKQRDKRWLRTKPANRQEELSQQAESFPKISLDIPTGELSDELQTTKMEFSNRGSMLFDGFKSNERNQFKLKDSPVGEKPAQAMDARPTKALSAEEETLSLKVRSYYAHGTETLEEYEHNSNLGQKIGLRWQDALGNERGSLTSLSRGTSATDIHSVVSMQHSAKSGPDSAIAREENELAGGVEDWQDIDGRSVDRYGFIIAKSEVDRNDGALTRNLTIRDTHNIQRVSTSLQLAAEAPRRKYTVRRTPSSAHGPGGRSLHNEPRSPSQRSATRPASSQSAYAYRQSSIRVASNRLPQNKDRRLLDEASNMMTLPRTTTMYMEDGQIISEDKRARRKEIEREEKWRKMAKPVSNSSLGGGMTFEFDTTSPKLIERTWKGIPDKWRATAWYAFLSASARKRTNHSTDDELFTHFHQYQEQSSPDDVQIDIDVPRTINSHIMFRRRYRGGQRLLFRVLHAMSLHFAEIGYVQGMAALAATLLAYYEEEKAFVMLVRMWELRGLEKLYRSGFAGLMAALNDFEKEWLGQGELAKKLDGLGIGPTAYGTRWYLTLFNYSIPFPAQLRVWDVFMLLGDDSTISMKHDQNEDVDNFGTTLDVLHATSAALIDGMRDILLESDFENAMKVLTSWIPIQDEDLFMRVAKTEWKMHKHVKS